MLRKSLTHDFNSIFEGTDKNISSIKRNLTSVDERINTTALRSPQPKNSSFGSLPQPQHTKSAHNGGYGSSNTSQTSLITSMFNRLEEQSKTISLLEAMVHTQTDEIRKIKNSQLEFRSSALQPQTGKEIEVRLENTEKELRREIEALRHIIKRGEQTNGFHDNGYERDRERERTQISEDVKAQRRLFEKESETLRREVDGLKSRVGKVEYDVSLSLKDSAEVGRKFARVENDVSNIISNQTNLKNANEGGERQLKNIKNELEEISSLMRKSRIDGITERNSNHRSSSKNHEKKSSMKKVVSAESSPTIAHGKRRSSMKAVSVDSSPTMSLPSPISDGASFNSFDFSEVDALSSISKEISNSKHLLQTTIDDNDDDGDDLINDDVDDILQFDSDVDFSPALRTKQSKPKSKKHISFLSDEDGEEDHLLAFDSDTDPASKIFDDDKLTARRTKHVSILDDDEDDVIAGFSAANDDDELFLEKEPDTLTLDKLSGDEQVSLGNFSDNSL